MFEARHSSAFQHGDADPAALRVPAWAEIVARLAASRDLRRALAGANRSRGGSFARLARGSSDPVNAWQGDVNQPGLADGRAEAGIVFAPTAEAARADRDTQ